MTDIKVSELFYSIQGEGRYMGVPSVFLRTFGCNFKCKNFGRNKADVPADESANPEVAEVIKNIEQYKTYKDLPLVTTGCDSYAAVYPQFKRFSPFMSVEDIAEKIYNILPFRQWEDEHLVITGGEPLLGWQKQYPALLEAKYMNRLRELTFETNGTQALSKEFKDYLITWTNSHGRPGLGAVTFSVSPKLSCSGESANKAIQPDVVREFEDVGFTYLKFVVATEEDVDEALEAIEIYRANSFRGPVYLMPLGGVNDVYALNNKRVAELAMHYGLRYSDRLQVPLFKNAWGT